MRKYCGVDLTLLFHEEMLEGALLWETWTRCVMGFRFSPYQTIQGVLWAEEVSMGDRHDPHHPFRFAMVAKLRCPGGPLASDRFVYVDDCCISAFWDSEYWLACQHVARIHSHLGLQDAPCKRRGPSTEPGPWAKSPFTPLPGLCVW